MNGILICYGWSHVAERCHTNTRSIAIVDNKPTGHCPRTVSTTCTQKQYLKKRKSSSQSFPCLSVCLSAVWLLGDVTEIGLSASSAVDSRWINSDWTVCGPDRTEPDRTGLDRTEPDRTGPAAMWSTAIYSQNCHNKRKILYFPFRITFR